MSPDETFRVRQFDENLLRQEVDRVLGLIRKVVPSASVMEVGSTAIEGVVGKQDLDFVVRVPSNRFDQARRIMDLAFSRNSQQISNGEYQGYVVPSPLDVAIQLIVEDGQYDTFEKFLLTVSADPALKRAYNDLKVAWDGRPMKEYRVAKRCFIDSVLSKTTESRQ